MLLFILIAQFNLYYQHNFGNMNYIFTYYDVNGDGHKDAVVTNGSDSVEIYTLPDNQLRAIYAPTPSYSSLNFVYTFGNNDILLYRYSYDASGGTYTGKIYYYSNYTTLSWESSEFTSYFYTYPVIQVEDVDGDGLMDIAVSYRDANNTLNLVIYKGNVTDIKENSESKRQGKNIHASLKNIVFTLAHSGRCKIDVFDKSGRLVGVYYHEGKKGENVFVPPFLPHGTLFYRIMQDGKRVNFGALVN